MLTAVEVISRSCKRKATRKQSRRKMPAKPTSRMETCYRRKYVIARGVASSMSSYEYSNISGRFGISRRIWNQYRFGNQYPATCIRDGVKA